MISLARIHLYVCALVALIAITPHHQQVRAEIDPSAAEEDPQAYSQQSLEVIADNQSSEEESETSAEWERLVKSMCLNLIATNDEWFAQNDRYLRHKCVNYLVDSPSSVRANNQNGNAYRQRRFFQINVGKTNALKSDSDAKGFKYGRK